MNKTFLRYAAAICGGIAVSFFLLLYNRTFSDGQPAYILKCLSDAFLAPASIYLGISALRAISLWGVFNMLAYSTRNFFRLFRPGMRDEGLPGDFYEYQKSRKDRSFELWHLLFPGIGFLALSLLFSILYLLM